MLRYTKKISSAFVTKYDYAFIQYFYQQTIMKYDKF